MDRPFWKEAMKAVYREQPTVLSMARTLKKNGYALGFLSNTEIPARDFNLECGYDFFDVRVYSCEEGLAKPESKIYELTAERLGVPISELLMVDDKEENIEGAEAAGAFGLLFKSPEQFCKELERFGISGLD